MPLGSYHGHVLCSNSRDQNRRCSPYSGALLWLRSPATRKSWRAERRQAPRILAGRLSDRGRYQITKDACTAGKLCRRGWRCASIRHPPRPRHSRSARRRRQRVHPPRRRRPGHDRRTLARPPLSSQQNQVADADARSGAGKALLSWRRRSMSAFVRSVFVFLCVTLVGLGPARLPPARGGAVAVRRRRRRLGRRVSHGRRRAAAVPDAQAARRHRRRRRPLRDGALFSAECSARPAVADAVSPPSPLRHVAALADAQLPIDFRCIELTPPRGSGGRSPTAADGAAHDAVARSSNQLPPEHRCVPAGSCRCGVEHRSIYRCACGKFTPAPHRGRCG